MMAKQTKLYERCMEIYEGIECRYGRALDRLAKGPQSSKTTGKDIARKRRDA